MTGDRTEFNAAIEEVVEATGLDRNSIIGPRQFRELVAARRQIARQLVRRGWSVHGIARELRRHHTTIMSLLEQPEDVPPTPSPSPAAGADSTPE